MKHTNFFIFLVVLSLLILSQSYTHVSTSLLSILPDGESKELIRSFEKTQNSKMLLLAVKGSDLHALEKIKQLEKALVALPWVSQKQMQKNSQLQQHRESYKLFIQQINEEKLSELDVAGELKALYKEMTTSFFPVRIDRVDPFKLLRATEPTPMKFKNAHLILGEYGYLSVFTIDADTLDEYKEVYFQVNTIAGDKDGVKFFSPLFYYVENSQAIMSDVNNIILIAFGVLLFLYIILLRNISLLLNTLTTLATSSMAAIMILAQFYDEVSIFVLVFGISISSIAIDYMFHHYMHGYYEKKRPYNREVLFGFLTTMLAFFILSFTSFVLIKQITIFAIISLAISYFHFSFLYPKIGFKRLEVQKNKFNLNLHFLNVKILFILSIIIIGLAPLWVRFDFNLKNLDYDNKTLYQTEQFFSKRLDIHHKMTFAIKADNIDTLITHAQTIHQNIDSADIPLASLLSQRSYKKNKAVLQSIASVKNNLNIEAEKLGFKKEYFTFAYDAEKPFIDYTQEDIQAYGIDIVKINESYITYGTVSKDLYHKVISYEYAESLSVKDRFELLVRESTAMLLKLGVLTLMVIILLLYSFTKKLMMNAMIFLIFPMVLVSMYAYFTPINILHIFMLIVLLSISIDYAIYLSRKYDGLTKQAIAYSLISTFAGFGVLIFSSINALYSLGVITTIGIVAIFILLVFMKRVENVS